jgi:hypothetical protein
MRLLVPPRGVEPRSRPSEGRVVIRWTTEAGQPVTRARRLGRLARTFTVAAEILRSALHELAVTTLVAPIVRLVPTSGLEPERPEGHSDLNAARLPIPPGGQVALRSEPVVPLEPADDAVFGSVVVRIVERETLVKLAEGFRERLTVSGSTPLCIFLVSESTDRPLSHPE